MFPMPVVPWGGGALKLDTKAVWRHCQWHRQSLLGTLGRGHQKPPSSSLWSGRGHTAVRCLHRSEYERGLGSSRSVTPNTLEPWLCVHGARKWTYSSLFLLYYLFVSYSLALYPRLSWNLLWIPDWPQIHASKWVTGTNHHTQALYDL